MSRSPEMSTPSEKGKIMTYFRNEYGQPNLGLREHLTRELGPGFKKHVEQVTDFGITRVRGLFIQEEISTMQQDIRRWEKTKTWDNDGHMGFDGNSGEQYLRTSEAISRAITHPGLHSLVTASFGQHPKLNFFKTVPSYERRAFQWHHDGYSEIGLKAMLFLTDIPDTGQAMRFIPGMHTEQWDTKSSRETRFNPRFAEQFEAYTCSGQAGDLLIFNPNSIHRGQRKPTVRRDILLFNFQPGIGRNYPVPHLAPSIAERLSPYELSIYGGGFESGSIPEEKFIQEDRAWKSKMDALYQNYPLPVHVIQTALNPNRIDEKITLLGQRNKKVNPHGPKFVDEVLIANVEEFKAAIKAKLMETNQVFIESKSYQQALTNYDINLDDQITTDLHGDLDLPIRLYHPHLDQKRDNAITQTRDGRGEKVIDNIVQRLVQFDYINFVKTDATSYDTIADRLLRYKGDLLSLKTEEKDKLHTDSFLSLLTDLSTMIKRGYTTDLARRTMLYTYLAGWTLTDKYHDDQICRMLCLRIIADLRMNFYSVIPIC